MVGRSAAAAAWVRDRRLALSRNSKPSSWSLAPAEAGELHPFTRDGRGQPLTGGVEFEIAQRNAPRTGDELEPAAAVRSAPVAAEAILCESRCIGLPICFRICETLVIQGYYTRTRRALWHSHVLSHSTESVRNGSTR